MLLCLFRVSYSFIENSAFLTKVRMLHSSDCLVADDQVCIEGVIFVDIGFGNLVALELIDDPIVARMLEISVIDYQVMKEHYFSGGEATAQLLLVYLGDL